VDTARLERELLRYAERPLRIGSFSAASNVTGLITDADAVSELLHRHGALACWDCAAAGPHREIDMKVGARPLAYKDAVFLSPHKFVGGPGTPGVLVVRRELVRNRVPTVPGGGTITYVHATDQHYHADPAVREEGGTPAIVDPGRAGLPAQAGRRGRGGRRPRDQLRPPRHPVMAHQPRHRDPRRPRRRLEIEAQYGGWLREPLDPASPEIITLARTPRAARH
jgi:hypothetical protein